MNGLFLCHTVHNSYNTSQLKIDFLTLQSPDDGKTSSLMN
jgi:hypothetical protein